MRSIAFRSRAGVGWLRAVAFLVTAISIFSTACGWRPVPAAYPPGTVTVAPIIDPGGESVSGPRRIFLAAPMTGSAIYYTLDGSTPDTNAKRYTEPILLDRTVTVRAIAVVHGCLPSAVTTKVFTIQPGPPRSDMGNSGP